VIGAYLGWRRRRRTAHEARAMIHETARILGNFRHRVTPEVAREVRSAVEVVQGALRSGDADAVFEATQQLDDKVGRHLSFGRKSRLREYLESIAIAVGLALLLRAFVVEAFKIPSGSMLPTLQIGDHLFVNKYLYGLRVPLTKLKFLELREPHRGEVIVFIYPKDEDKDFIKRIVGVPGDTVEVRQSRLFINGQAVHREAIAGPCRYEEVEEGTGIRSERRCEQFWEELGDARYLTYYDPAATAAAYRRGDFPPKRIGPHQVFVMGDNRDNSSDSRVWGTVPYDNIKGKALFIWLSLGGDDFLGVRWNRMFRPVR
jgi:signal peptidase I